MVHSYILAAVIGLCAGSFFNVVLARLDRKAGMLTGRSECPDCHTVLKWYDLVPVASYLALAGRCRYCRKKISPVYPIVEVTTALVLVTFVWRFGPAMPRAWLFNLVLLGGFTLLAFFDYLYLILPDKIVGLMGVATAIYLVFFQPNRLLSSAVAGFVLAGFFGILYMVSRGRWMGLGDVKLAFVIGLAFGYPFGVLAVMAAIWLAALLGMALLAARRATMKTALPFGSFLSLASAIYIIFQNDLSRFSRFF